MKSMSERKVGNFETQQKYWFKIIKQKGGNIFSMYPQVQISPGKHEHRKY